MKFVIRGKHKEIIRFNYGPSSDENRQVSDKF